jgi:hypothetical protein
MPQLVKGGKHTFGWSQVSSDGKIAIPPDAFAEYKFIDGDRSFLFSGSKTSGGFGLTTSKLLGSSPIFKMISARPELSGFKIPEGQFVEIHSRIFCWITIQDQCIFVPENTLRHYSIRIGAQLLTVRGSGLALGFIVRGPIIEEAKKHPDLPVY